MQTNSTSPEAANVIDSAEAPTPLMECRMVFRHDAAPKTTRATRNGDSYSLSGKAFLVAIAGDEKLGTIGVVFYLTRDSDQKLLRHNPSL